MNQASSDLATLLAEEFAVWFRNLATQRMLPRAFTGVTKDGRQSIVILDGLPLDHIQRRDFLVWLCQTEQFIAYAYATHVGIVDSASTFSEGLEIYASSDSYDVTKTLGIDTLSDDGFRLLDHHHAAMSAGPKNGIFLGLQRSSTEISSKDQVRFSKLWREMSERVMRRQR